MKLHLNSLFFNRACPNKLDNFSMLSISSLRENSMPPMRSGLTSATTGHKERLAAQRQAIHKDVKIICFDVMFV